MTRLKGKVKKRCVPMQKYKTQSTRITDNKINS